MDQVHQVLQPLGDFTALRQVIAPLEQLRPAHAQFDGEGGAHLGADGGEDLPGKAQAIFQTAAVLVPAMVEIGGEKLIDQPTVTSVDHNHLITCPLSQGSGIPIGSDNVGDLLCRQPLDRVTIRPHSIAGAVLAQGRLLRPVRQVGAGVLPGVRELDGRDGAVAADGVGGIGVGGQATGGSQVQVEHVGTVRLRVDHQLTDGDRGGPALGPQFVEAHRPGPGTAVRRDVGGPHGGGAHPVAEGDAANLDGAGEKGVSSSIHVKTSFQHVTSPLAKGLVTYIFQYF